jgi:cell division protein FtsB
VGSNVRAGSIPASGTTLSFFENERRNINMDILSFILGMSIVVVIAVAVVAVMAFVKVKKHNKEIEIIHTIMSGEFERVR